MDFQSRPLPSHDNSAASHLEQAEERRWREFFHDPSVWWDNRSQNLRPHFKHVTNKTRLWIDSPQCPVWVGQKLKSLRDAAASHRGKAQYRSGASDTVVWGSKENAGSGLLAELKECSRSRNVEKGKWLHSQAISSGKAKNKYVANSLINMYGHCGCMPLARDVFDSMGDAKRTVVSWNALLQGYVDNGEAEIALELLDQMRKEEQLKQGGCLPNARTYVAALTACAMLAVKDARTTTTPSAAASSRWLEKGKALHAQLVERGCRDIFVDSTLVDMYAKCGSMGDCKCVFDSMPQRNVVAWNALLNGYVENGECELALEVFDGMAKVIKPDGRSYVAAISACAALAAGEDHPSGVRGVSQWLAKGKELHCLAVSSRCCDVFVESVLVDMYSKCGSMADARAVLQRMSRPDVVAWTALLQGYADNGDLELALELFDELEDVFVNDRTFVVALSTCASLAAEAVDKERWLEKGKLIHARALKSNCCCDDRFVQNTLVDMYGKCGSMKSARAVFDRMVENRDIVSWTALLMGYVDNGENEVALKLIAEMDLSGVGLDPRIFVPAVKACGNLMAVENGKAFHAEIVDSGFEGDVVVANCLVDFYGKSGNMDSAKQVFDSISKKTIISWNSLISGYSQQGNSDRVFEGFDKMREQGMSPSELTFTHVLTACSHAGLTDKGREFFDAMEGEYGIHPTVEHYACMVDLHGRANELDEALRIARNMPFEADAVVWCALLSSCSKWSNVAVAEVAYEALVRLEGQAAPAYVLMANIYGSAGMFEEQEKMLGMMREANG